MILFLVVLFIVLIAVVILTGIYLKKLMTVLHFSTEVKLKAIVMKLKITDEEINEAVGELKKSLPPDELARVEKDYRDLWS